MKNLKHIKYFLNENIDEYNIIKNKILETVHSDIYSFRNYSFIRKGETIFNKFMRELLNNNIDVDYFMKKYKDRVMRDIDFINNCGIIDMLLYKYDKIHPLSGELLRDGIILWNDTALIKYQYGYHLIDLGKKYLFQSYDNLVEFYKVCAEEFPLQFLTNNVSISGTPKDYINDYSDIMKVNNDCYASIIDIKSLCDAKLIRNEYNTLIHTLTISEIKFEIDNGLLIAYFGDNTCKITQDKIDKVRNRINLNIHVKKYNL